MKEQHTSAYKFSYAYRAGYDALMSGAAEHGTINLSPSIAERQDWQHAWKDFMRGWRQAQKHWRQP